MKRIGRWIQGTSELLANEIFPLQCGGPLRDIGWIAIVNITDFVLASFVFGIGLTAFLNAIQFVSYAQESGHLPPGAETNFPSPNVSIVAMLIMLIHAVLREIVAPLIKGRNGNGHAKVEEPRPPCIEMAIMKERIEAQRQHQLDFEDRIIGDIKRLFEIHDERRTRR